MWPLSNRKRKERIWKLVSGKTNDSQSDIQPVSEPPQKESKLQNNKQGPGVMSSIKSIGKGAKGFIEGILKFIAGIFSLVENIFWIIVAVIVIIVVLAVLQHYLNMELPFNFVNWIQMSIDFLKDKF